MISIVPDTSLDNGVPEMTPAGDIFNPDGNRTSEKLLMGLSLNVVTGIWKGVMTRFWMKVKLEVGTVPNVKISFRTAKFVLRVAVAGEPVATAVTARAVMAVTVSGNPLIMPLLSNVIPVPARAGADSVTGRPEAACALN
jgi:hypothetical protein